MAPMSAATAEEAPEGDAAAAGASCSLGGGELGGRVTGESGQPSTDPGGWAAENSKDRQLAWQWLSTQPLPQLMRLRSAIKPLLNLMHCQLDMSGRKWELARGSKVAAKILTDGVAPLGSRDYRISVAAGLVLENQFFTQLGEMWHGSFHWQSFPDQSLTLKFNALAFRLISRQGALVHQLLKHSHEMFHVKVFKLLNDPGLAQQLIDTTPECMRGPWGEELLRMHPGLSGLELQQKLCLMAQTCTLDMAEIEARHASIRRRLVSRSVQTHCLNILDASTEWYFQQMRTSRVNRVGVQANAGQASGSTRADDGVGFGFAFSQRVV